MTQQKLSEIQADYVRQAAASLRSMTIWEHTEEGDVYWGKVCTSLDRIAKHGTSDGKPYVAPIVIGEGWRQLKAGELVEQGDEFWDTDYDEWIESNNYSGGGNQSSSLTYRRRVYSSADYFALHEASGLKVGDTVRVVREAKTEEKGWQNSWDVSMTYSICKTGVIKHDSGPSGFCVDTGGSSFNYPCFVLDKVVKPEPAYRPFANAEEFKPHRSRWIKTAKGNIRHVDLYRETGLLGMSWLEAFSQLKFEDDGSPFGVKVK